MSSSDNQVSVSSIISTSNNIMWSNKVVVLLRTEFAFHRCMDRLENGLPREIGRRLERLLVWDFRVLTGRGTQQFLIFLNI